MFDVRRMIVDVSSVCWTGLLAGKDDEHGYKVEHEGKQFLVNSAAFGYENVISHVTSVMKQLSLVPHQLIFVIEGENSKILRKSFLHQYKEDRDSRPPQAYEEFNKLKEMLAQSFLGLGAQVVQQDGIEADDVIAYLAQELAGERIILTNDKDLARLTCDGVALYRMGELVTENPWGPFDYKYITLYKALVGGKDNVPGAKGFGPKAFLDLLCVFGNDGLAALEDMIKRKKLEELADDVGELKALQKLIDNAEMVYLSYAASKLYPEKVNTLRKPLQWRAGMVRPMTKDLDERLKPWAGRVKLIHAGNYAEAVQWMKPYLEASTFVGLDIETSTCDESDEWLAAIKKKSTDDEKLGVDVFGSELTSLGLTFGDNQQYTFYFTVDHRETATVKNITKVQMLDVMKMIPSSTQLETVVHNDSFELSVLKQTWQDDEAWQNNGWHGFLPHVRDTIDCASYVNENESFGLKKLSLRLLGYEQQSYDDVTTMVGTHDNLPKGGRVTQEVEVEPGLVQVQKRYRMNELTAEHVLHYGSDDPICTAALYNHFRIIMEIEKTWEVFKQVEQKPAYLAALGFVQGTPFSLERMKELEKEDDKLHAAAWVTMRDFLIAEGWEGTICPVYEEITPAAIKEAVLIVTGLELKTAVRTVSKFPALIRALLEDEPKLEIIAHLVEKNDIANLNKLVGQNFTGEPDINFDSPKQMQKLLYYTLNLPVRIVNKLTPNERAEKKELAVAVTKFNKICQGSSKAVALTDDEKELLKLKAATDDTAVDFALAYDCPEGTNTKAVLEAMTAVKKVETRRKLYYRPYPLLRHWKDGKLHPSLNQNQAVTRRYSDSGPNRQQLAKKGEGVKVREVITPHCHGGVIISLDFAGQELRSAAEQSQDVNMLACYIGDNLKDLHSLTAAGAMKKKWGAAVVEALFVEYGQGILGDDYALFSRLHKLGKEHPIGKKADDLRKIAKEINFGSQYDAQALTLSKTIVIPVEEAQAFLDARDVMYPGITAWKEKVRNLALKTGCAFTLMGARRHLQAALLSDDKWEAERAGRQAPNFAIQGSSAEQTKLAMARLWDSGVFFRCNAVFIAPVHDELVLSAHREDALEVIKEAFKAMTAPYASMKIPNVASISLGPNFGVQHEVGESVNDDIIHRTIDKIFGSDSNALKAA